MELFDSPLQRGLKAFKGLKLFYKYFMTKKEFSGSVTVTIQATFPVGKSLLQIVFKRNPQGVFCWLYRIATISSDMKRAFWTRHVAQCIKFMKGYHALNA